MVRAPFYDKRSGLKKGAWSVEEDNKLRAYIQRHGHPTNWRELPKYAGLSRCGKGCRLRWVNYLHPGVKRGNYTQEEDDLISQLHQQHGNKWSMIAARLPGRTDNDIKNHWYTITKKRMTKKQNPTSSANTQLHHNIDDASNPVLDHQIFESSPLSAETLSSTEYSSLTYNEAPTISAMKYCINNNADQEDHTLQSSPETPEILDQYFGCSGDFWTEPFVQDLSWGRDVPEEFIMSPGSYASFVYNIDHGMDLFYQVMPTCQDNNYLLN